MFQKLARRQDTQTKFFSPGKISTVVGNDSFAVSGNRYLQKQVVPWVPKIRAPKEKYLLSIGNGAEVIKHIPHISFSQRDLFQVAKQSVFILKHEWNGETDFKPSFADQGKHSKRSAFSGT